MALQPHLPKAEAKVVVRDFGTENWRDSLDLDPVQLPIEQDLPFTDVFDSTVIALVDVVVEADAGFSEHRTEKMLEYRIVWSETGHDVKGTCPVCDDVFPIAEGAPGDELNEGYDAVFCGCDPRDQDYADEMI